MNRYTERKATGLISEYLRKESIKANNESIASQLENITLNGREVVEILSKVLSENYVPKKDYDKLRDESERSIEIKAYQSLK